MRRILFAAFVGSSIFVVAACGAPGQVASAQTTSGSPSPSQTPSPTPSPSQTPSETPTPTPKPTPTGPPKSVRGNLVAHVGDVLKLQYNGVDTVVLTVKSITPNAECQTSMFNPDRGQSVVLDMEITTTPELAQDPYPTFATIFEWKAVTSNGTTVNGRIDNINCLAPAQRVPSEIGPSEKIVGKMAFDVPPGAGTLIWRPSGVTSGWEWAYPAQ
jgi:hypothetical protein